tara:strand:+ start:1405 stop:3480 length:2076 start_codon:yes stop_codon:yes gene_type:complete
MNLTISINKYININLFRLATCLFFIILASYVFYYGKSKNMNKVIPEALEDHVSALSVAISNVKYDLNKGYLYYRDIYSTLEVNGLTKKKVFLDQLNFKHPENIINKNTAGKAIEETLYLRLNTKNPALNRGDIVFSGGDIGLADFYEISFRIFGIEIESIFKLYFLVIIISGVLFFYSIREGPLHILPFLFLSSLLIIINQIYISDHLMENEHIKTNFNMGTLISFRFLSIIAVIPFLNLIFLHFQNKPLNLIQSFSVIFQTMIIITTFKIRISSYWILLAILILTFLYLVYLYIKSINNKDKRFDLINNSKKFILFSSFLILFLYLVKNIKTIFGFPYMITRYFNLGIIKDDPNTFNQFKVSAVQLLNDFNLNNLTNFFSKLFNSSVLQAAISQHYINFLLICCILFGIYILWKKFIVNFFKNDLLILQEIEKLFKNPKAIFFSFLILFFLDSIFFNLKVHPIFFTDNAKTSHAFYHNAFIGISQHPNFYDKYGDYYKREGGFNQDNIMDPLSYNEAYRLYKEKFSDDFEFDFMKHFTTPYKGDFLPQIIDDGAKEALINFIKKDPVMYLQSFYFKFTSAFEYLKYFFAIKNLKEVLMITLIINLFIFLFSILSKGVHLTMKYNSIMIFTFLFIFLISFTPVLWAYPSFHILADVYVTSFMMLSILINLILSIFYEVFKFSKKRSLIKNC